MARIKKIVYEGKYYSEAVAILNAKIRLYDKLGGRKSGLYKPVMRKKGLKFQILE